MKKKIGRPTNNEPSRPALEIVTFKIDPAVKAALEELRPSVGADVRGWRSVLLRRLVLEAAALKRQGRHGGEG